MLEGKAVVRETDMAVVMQSHAMELAYQALDLNEVSDCQAIAHFIKQSLMKHMEQHGFVLSERNLDPALHICGCFKFFYVKTMDILIFKDRNDFTSCEEEAIGIGGL